MDEADELSRLNVVQAESRLTRAVQESTGVSGRTSKRVKVGYSRAKWEALDAIKS